MDVRFGFKQWIYVIILCGLSIVIYAFYLPTYLHPAVMHMFDSSIKGMGLPNFATTSTAQDHAFDDIYLPPSIRNMPIINPHNFKYILNPTWACSGEVEVVICVTSTRADERARRIVTETWGSYASNKANKAVVLFFLGNATNNESHSVQKSIEDEFKRNQNIVQEDYVDAYRNLSLKSMSILKWLGMFCHHASYVIKADADIFSNMSLLVQNLRDTHSYHEKLVNKSGYTSGSKVFDPRHFIMGHLMNNIKPFRTDSKYLATMEEFSGDVYPTYVSGTCYSMPVNTARYLFQIATRTKLFWMEDIFITGISSSRGKVAKYHNRYQRLGQIHQIRGCNFKMLASAHTYTSDQIKQIYTELHDPNGKC